jgi:hypothetical protein
MWGREWLACVALVAALSLVGGCSPEPEQSAAKREAPTLTPELAREALLELMRTDREGDLSLFDPVAWAKVGIEKEENGWYAFGGSFRIHPARAVYTLTIRPRPGVRACRFEYEGGFVLGEDGQWVATAPKWVSSALQSGE